MEILPNTIEKYESFQKLYYELPRDKQIEIEVSYNYFYINTRYSNSFHETSSTLPVYILTQLVKYTSNYKINSYMFSSHEYRLNKRYALESLTYNINTLRDIPIVLKLNKEFILECIYTLSNDTIKFLELYHGYVSNLFLLEDIDINLAIVHCKTNVLGIPFNYIHPKYKNDSMIIDVALQNCIHNITVIDEQYITLEHINKMFEIHINNHQIFIILFKYLTYDRVLNIIKHNPENLRYVPITYATKELYLIAVNSNGLLLQHVKSSYKHDKEIVYIAEKNNKLSIIYADNSFITDEKIKKLCEYDRYTYYEESELLSYIADLPRKTQIKYRGKIAEIKLINKNNINLDILNRKDVLEFVKLKDRNYPRNIQHFKNILNNYNNDIEIISHLELELIVTHGYINSNLLYNYLLNTKLHVLYKLDTLSQLKCITEFNIEMIYNLVSTYNKYLILFDSIYYDCKILNKYAIYYTHKKYAYFKLFLMRNMYYDISFVYNNVLKYLIKYI